MQYAAKLLRIGKDAQQPLGQGLFRPKGVQQRLFHRAAFRNSVNIWLHPTPQEAAIVVAGPHHYGEVRQLCSPVINVQAVQIVLNNALHSVLVGVAHGAINVHQHIKRIDQNVT